MSSAAGVPRFLKYSEAQSFLGGRFLRFWTDVSLVARFFVL